MMRLERGTHSISWDIQRRKNNFVQVEMIKICVVVTHVKESALESGKALLPMRRTVLPWIKSERFTVVQVFILPLIYAHSEKGKNYSNFWEHLNPSGSIGSNTKNRWWNFYIQEIQYFIVHENQTFNFMN